MNLIPSRLRHGMLRMLGVVSPSGAYPLPPRWAMSRKGKARYYQVTPSGGYRSISSQPLCVSATCPGCADTRNAVNDHERGSGRG